MKKIASNTTVLNTIVYNVWRLHIKNRLGFLLACSHRGMVRHNGMKKLDLHCRPFLHDGFTSLHELACLVDKYELFSKNLWYGHRMAHY